MDTLLAEFRSQIDELADMLTLQLLPLDTDTTNSTASSSSSSAKLSSLLVTRVDALSSRVHQLQSNLMEEHESLRSAEDLKLRLDVQAAHLQHLLANIPAALPEPIPEVVEQPIEKPNTKKGNKKAKGENEDPNVLKRGKSNLLAKTPRNKTEEKRDKVSPLTELEFAQLPRYLLGRLTLEKINDMITEFNTLVSEKYHLLSLPQKSLSKLQRDKLLSYRDQEKPETRGRHFVTEQEVRDVAREKFKMDPSGKTVVAIMRSTGRVKEVRGGGHNRIIVV